MTRRLIADHELPNKVAAGRLDEIRPCCGCCYCVETRMDDGPQKCRVNPESGREREYEITPATKKKRVMIAGARTGRHGGGQSGGPARPRGHHLRQERSTGWASAHRRGGQGPRAGKPRGSDRLLRRPVRQAGREGEAGARGRCGAGRQGQARRAHRRDGRKERRPRTSQGWTTPRSSTAPLSIASSSSP